MNEQRELMRGNVPVGGRQPLRPNRRFEIMAKDFSSVEQAVPLRYLAGNGRAAAVQITPIWAFRSEAIETEAGK